MNYDRPLMSLFSTQELSFSPHMGWRMQIQWSLKMYLLRVYKEDDCRTSPSIPLQPRYYANHSYYCSLRHYAKNSNRRHRLETRPQEIVFDLVNRDVSASVRHWPGSREGEESGWFIDSSSSFVSFYDTLEEESSPSSSSPRSFRLFTTATDSSSAMSRLSLSSSLEVIVDRRKRERVSRGREWVVDE
jgi:hypothetical protein